MKTYTLKTDFGNYKLTVRLSNYRADGSLAILLEDADDGAPFATLTVLLYDDDLGIPFPHSAGTAFVDTNNCGWASEFIKANGLGEPTGVTWRSGFCTYPLYKFNLENLKD